MAVVSGRRVSTWRFSFLVATIACGGQSSPPTDAGTGDGGDANACTVPDGDSDGFASARCGGQDCDDDDPLINPEGDDASPRHPWTFVRLEGSIEVSLVAIAVDGAGVAHLAHSRYVPGGNPPQDVEVGEIGPGTITWSSIEVARGPVYPLTIAAGESDAEMLWGAEGHLYHASQAEGWSPVLVEVGTEDESVDRVSLVQDSEGITHAFYRRFHRPPTDAVHAQRGSDGSWNVIERVGGTAAAFSPEGDLLIAYDVAGDLYVDRAVDGEWSTELVDDVEETGATPSVAVDATGRVFVAYQHYTRGDLKVAIWDGSWSLETIDQNGRVGYRNTIALDGRGEPAVAYDEPYEGSVRIARHDAAGWTYGRLSSPVRTWDSPRLAVAPTGALIVAFASKEHELWIALAGRDGVDQNCDGIDAVDADGDGHTSVDTGGDDCFDGDAQGWRCEE